jgi:hypothetical protein
MATPAAKMTTHQALTRIVARLLQLTQEGRIEWVREKPPAHLRHAHDEAIEAVYTTTHSGRRLRLFEPAEDYWLDEADDSIDRRVVLELVDAEGYSEWQFPRVPGIAELYDAVRFSTSNVKGFIEDFLAEEPTAAQGANPKSER